MDNYHITEPNTAIIARAFERWPLINAHLWIVERDPQRLYAGDESLRNIWLRSSMLAFFRLGYHAAEQLSATGLLSSNDIAQIAWSHFPSTVLWKRDQGPMAGWIDLVDDEHVLTAERRRRVMR